MCEQGHFTESGNSRQDYFRVPSRSTLPWAFIIAGEIVPSVLLSLSKAPFGGTMP